MTGRSHAQQLDWSTISSNIVLIGPELSAFRCNTLQILLSWSIGVANLQQKTLFAYWLAMEFLDDLLTNLPALKSRMVSLGRDEIAKSTYRANPTPRLLF